MTKWRKLFAAIFPSNPEIGQIGSIDLNIWIANIAGVPLIGIKRESHIAKGIIVLYGLGVITLICFIYSSFEVCDLVLRVDDLDKLTKNISLLLTHISGAFKTLNLIYRYNDLKSVIEKLKYVAKTYIKSKKQLESFNNGEVETKIALIIYLIMVDCTAILGFIFLFMYPENIAGKVFPYRVLLPDWLPPFWQHLYMGLSVLIFGTQIVAVDILNVNIINQIRFQLIIINLSFDELIVDTIPSNIKDSKALDLYKENPLKRLNSIIVHHCLLKEIRQLTENIFSRPVLFQFFSSLVIFAMTGFQATVKNYDNSGAILIYFYCGCIFCQLFVYCWFGNEVFEQSKTLATRGFNSSWYLYDQRYGKSLVIFLANAQQPFLFTAGGFIGLSLPTFAGILSKSYSYIALLRQIYGNK
ncbi:putative odorant receptor 92a [Cochliomyia hominivorax]